MPVEHSPPGGANRVHQPPVNADAVPNISVLRARRTRARKALETEALRLREFERIDDSNRLEILTARARIDGRAQEIREVIDRICVHPLLREDESEREAEDAEAAIAEAISARAIVEALLAMQASESNASDISDSSSTMRANVPNRRGDTRVHDVIREPSATASSLQTITATTTEVSSADSDSARSKSSSAASRSACVNSTLYLDITPEIFDGTSSRYNLWRSQFMNHIRRRILATNTDKLVTLCKFLKGPPKDLICELPRIDNNFDVAIKLLDDNYDIPELHKRDVLANITTVPCVRHVNDTVALRELLNVTQRTILSLEAVKVPLPSVALTYEQTIRAADNHASQLRRASSTVNYSVERR